MLFEQLPYIVLVTMPLVLLPPFALIILVTMPLVSLPLCVLPLFSWLRWLSLYLQRHHHLMLHSSLFVLSPICRRRSISTLWQRPELLLQLFTRYLRHLLSVICGCALYNFCLHDAYTVASYPSRCSSNVSRVVWHIIRFLPLPSF